MSGLRMKVKRSFPLDAEGLATEEEERLSKKLFGSNHERVAESSSDEECSSVVEQEVEATAVWHDDDDVSEEVEVSSGKTCVLLKRSNDSGGSIAADEYGIRLRKVFQRQQRGTPKWASLEQKVASKRSKRDGSDSEVEQVFDELTHSSTRYVEKDPLLVKNIVSSFRWPDITVGHSDSRQVNVVLFHNVRPVVFTAGSSGKVQLFRLGDRTEAGNFLQNVQFADFPVTSMSLLHGGCSVMCGSTRQEYFMKYDLEKGTIMQLELPKCLPRQNVGRFAVSKDGSLLAMIARSAKVFVLSSSSMELIQILSAPAEVKSLQFLSDSSRELWAITERGDVIIWNLCGSQHVFRDDGAVRSTKIRISGDGAKVACGSNTGIINVYNVAEVRHNTYPKPEVVVKNLLTSCDSIAFNHDGQIMAFSSNVKKNQIKLLHLASSSVFSNYPRKFEKLPNVECVEFSPHSAYMGVGCSNGRLIIERLNHFDLY